MNQKTTWMSYVMQINALVYIITSCFVLLSQGQYFCDSKERTEITETEFTIHTRRSTSSSVEEGMFCSFHATQKNSGRTGYYRAELILDDINRALNPKIYLYDTPVEESTHNESKIPLKWTSERHAFSMTFTTIYLRNGTEIGWWGTGITYKFTFVRDCQRPWLPYKNSRCILFKDMLLPSVLGYSYSDAQEYCNSAEGNLLTLTSTQEVLEFREQFQSKLLSNSLFWFGLNDLNVQCSYRWIDGRRLDDPSFMECPNCEGFGNDRCFTLHMGNSESLAYTTSRKACEKKLPVICSFKRDDYSKYEIPIRSEMSMCSDRSTTTSRPEVIIPNEKHENFLQFFMYGSIGVFVVMLVTACVFKTCQRKVKNYPRRRRAPLPTASVYVLPSHTSSHVNYAASICDVDSSAPPSYSEVAGEVGSPPCYEEAVNCATTTTQSEHSNAPSENK